MTNYREYLKVLNKLHKPERKKNYELKSDPEFRAYLEREHRKYLSLQEFKVQQHFKLLEKNGGKPLKKTLFQQEYEH